MAKRFLEIWKFWYNLQVDEQESNSKRFNEKPTVVPAQVFSPEGDANSLHAAMKGLGTDEQAIINILTKRSVSQRLKIQEAYEQIHEKDLVADLQSELTGTFEKVIVALMKPRHLFLAENVMDAAKGTGTDVDALIEIFCTRDDDSIKAIRDTFEETYGENMLELVQQKTSAEFKRTLFSIISTTDRDTEEESPSEVAEKLTLDNIMEDDIRLIMTYHSFPYLKEVADLYLQKTEEELSTVLEKFFSGKCLKAFLAIYQSIKSRPEYYARALNDAIKGFGTDDSALIRIIVSRCEIDLQSIKEKYAEIFEGHTLEEDVKSEVSGDYENVLMALLGC